MTSEGKTSTEQLDLLMKALKTSIRKALDDELIENGPWTGPKPAPDAPLKTPAPPETGNATAATETKARPAGPDDAETTE